VIAPLLAGYPDMAVAAINAPQQCVISGGFGSMAAVEADLSRREIDFTRLAVSQASHSPLMAEVADGLREELAGIRYTEPAITIVSTVSGQVARLADISAGYWVRHVLEPVNFVAAIRALDKRGKHLFIEVSPFATLSSLGKRCVPAGRHVWLASMHPSDRDGITILESAAKAYTAGQAISWPAFHRGHRGRKAGLPSYAFDRKPYWLPVGPVGSPVGSSAARPVAPAGPGAAAVDQIPPAQAAQAPPGQDAGNGAAGTASLAAPDGTGRLATLVELIRGKVAAVLEFSDASEVAADVDFTDLGMDSLLAVKLRKELCAALPIEFPTPELFNNPSPRRLAEFLDGQLEKAG
jgi:acyl transferase domain-containing protein